MKSQPFPYQRLIAIVGACLLAIFLGGLQAAKMQQKPLTLAEILTGLRSKKVTLPEKNQLLTEGVKERSTSFPLTAEIEKELRSAGASEQLIEAIRQKNNPSPAVSPTPKPIPTPEPIVGTPGAASVGKMSEYAENLPKKAKLEMVCLGGGTFVMGAPVKEDKSMDYERPQHYVAVKDFCIGKYEITQGQWKAVMGTTLKQQWDKTARKFPFFGGEGDNYPMAYVSWTEAKQFAAKLSQLTGREYRLPTEAEWEFAARGGTTTATAFGDAINSNQANFEGTSPYPYVSYDKTAKNLKTTTPVGSYLSNAWGIYDAHGNVGEWVEDVSTSSYKDAPADGSANVKGDDPDYKIVRGGSYNSDGQFMRSAVRSDRQHFDSRFSSIGFRIVSTAKKP